MRNIVEHIMDILVGIVLVLPWIILVEVFGVGEDMIF